MAVVLQNVLLTSTSNKTAKISYMNIYVNIVNLVPLNIILLSKCRNCKNCNCHRTSGNRAVAVVALVVSVVIGF